MKGGDRDHHETHHRIRYANKAKNRDPSVLNTHSSVYGPSYITISLSSEKDVTIYLESRESISYPSSPLSYIFPPRDPANINVSTSF
jgi:hypothetical protein